MFLCLATLAGAALVVELQQGLFVGLGLGLVQGPVVPVAVGLVLGLGLGLVPEAEVLVVIGLVLGLVVGLVLGLGLFPRLAEVGSYAGPGMVLGLIHSMPIGDLNKEEKERLRMDNIEDIQVMRVCIADPPPALPLEVLKEGAERDRVHQKLKEAGKTGRKPKDRDMVPYMAVWEKLRVGEELVCRGRGESSRRAGTRRPTGS